MRDAGTGKLRRWGSDAKDSELTQEQIDEAIQTGEAVWIYTKDPSVQAFTYLMNEAHWASQPNKSRLRKNRKSPRSFSSGRQQSEFRMKHQSRIYRSGALFPWRDANFQPVYCLTHTNNTLVREKLLCVRVDYEPTDLTGLQG